jgi:diguanylate cyclase (GGDEF)-like protein
VTARLLALVMLPVTAMCFLTGSVVLSHQSTAVRAHEVEQGIVDLRALVELRDALHSLQTVAAFEQRSVELGVEREVATAFLGFDWTTFVAPARSQAAQAIAVLGDKSPVSAADLRELNEGIDAGSIAPAAALTRLGGYIDRGSAMMAASLDRLGAATHYSPLVDALGSLRLASAMVDSSTPQAVELSKVWFPSLGAAPQAATAGLVTVAVDTATYATALNELRGLGDEHVLANLAYIESDPGVQGFEAAVASTLMGQPLTEAGGVLDTAYVADTFRGFFARDDLLDRLVISAATVVRDEARQLAASEQRGLLGWAFGSGAMALISIAIALWFARSISTPLKNLARYAGEVNDGNLDAQLPTHHDRGPRETQVAFSTFTDLVANLQLLDAKTNALAQCDFDDPVLREPLPGRLGRSLESSVTQLSGSIVERGRLETRLAHEATHDALTGIGNRPAAISAIEAAMHRAVRTGATTALFFVDLNDFKAVNDSHGHGVGDEVLRRVAARLAGDLRSGDFLARLGGDEFVVVAEGIEDVGEATHLARRIIEAVSRPIEFDGFSINIGAAVGVGLTLDGPEEPLHLLARADAAMYRAKRRDRSAIEIFDATLQREMIEREDVESALTAALAAPDSGGLQLHYQPVLDARSGELVGAEALIRWDRPDHGMLAPDSFIPIAEATALIIDVDCWVLREATRQLAAWSPVAELAELPVAVNISGRHLLSRHLPGHISAALDDSGIDAHRLTIEITETVLLADLVSAAAELDAVRALGVKVAVDDFGTGYTSLAHLQQLPIDTLKIDRSFISQLNVRRGSSLVRMVTDLGHAIDINIVAEGVETPEELQALQEIGADHIQGYLLSRPLAPSTLATWAHDRVANGYQLSLG